MDISTSIDKETLAALRAGYKSLEMAAHWGIPHAKILKIIKDPHRKALFQSHPEAFMDGVSLLNDSLFVQSADTLREYQQDVALYNETATRLNEKYGRVAYLEDENKSRGIIEEHHFPWATNTEEK